MFMLSFKVQGKLEEVLLIANNHLELSLQYALLCELYYSCNPIVLLWMFYFIVIVLSDFISWII